MAELKLAEKTLALFEYVKENGGDVTVDDACAGLDRNSRSINASVTDLVKKELAERVKTEGAEGEKGVTNIVLTAKGQAFVQPAAKE